MKFYVGVFVPRAALVCSHVPLSSYFCTPRTRMTRLRSRGTKVRTCRTTLLKSEVASEVEATWPTLRPHRPRTGDIIAFLLSDHALRSNRRSLGRIALLLQVLVTPSSTYLFSVAVGCSVSLIDEVLWPQGWQAKT
jgi:hypothetical protein